MKLNMYCTCIKPTSVNRFIFTRQTIFQFAIANTSNQSEMTQTSIFLFTKLVHMQNYVSRLQITLYFLNLWQWSSRQQDVVLQQTSNFYEVQITNTKYMCNIMCWVYKLSKKKSQWNEYIVCTTKRIYAYYESIVHSFNTNDCIRLTICDLVVFFLVVD